MTIQAFILAAGIGARMRPLTNDRPKPIVEVHGKPMIDYALDSLAETGITKCVINTHYKADILEAHLSLKKYPFDIVVSHEKELLDTGGGLKKGLQHLDADLPVLVLSGDSILVDAPQLRSLPTLVKAWDDAKMDLLLLLQPLETMVLTQGIGDYTIKNDTPARSHDQSGNYMWTSARILHPRLFADTPDGPFSFLTLMDKAEKQRRLSAQIHKGTWHHLSTPEDVARVNAQWIP